MKTYSWSVKPAADGYISGGTLIQVTKGKFIVHRWHNNIDQKTPYLDHIYYKPNKKEVKNLLKEFDILKDCVNVVA